MIGVLIYIPVSALKTTPKTPTPSFTIDGMGLTIRGFVGDVDGLADIYLLEHSHCHLIGYFQRILAKAAFDTLRSILVNTLLYLLDC